MNIKKGTRNSFFHKDEATVCFLNTNRIVCDVHTKELSGFIISLFYVSFELLRELLHLYR